MFDHAPPLILRVAIPIRLYRLFDYLAPAHDDPDYYKPGIRVRVPFGRTSKVAVVIACVKHSEVDRHKLKPIEAVIDEQPLLSDQDMQLLAWVSRYYHHPLGDVYNTALPTLLRQGKAAHLPTEDYYAITDTGRAMTRDQLKRAFKQKALIEKLQQCQTPLSESELAVWDSKWRTTIKHLLDKDWVQITQAHDIPPSLSPVLRAEALISNPQQQAAIDAVCTSLGQFKVFLLEGVTGSGKTEVYMQIIQSVLQQQQQVLVLVPEITLTPQLQDRFRQRFAVDIAVSHSKLTDNQRHNAWLNMQQGRCSIMLGTRSALFTPMQRPGLIILDEEHDASFKQQEGCRFSARDVAIVRGKIMGIPIVLGSATPALESLHNANQGRYQLLPLSSRAGNALPPTFQLLDIRNKKMQEGLSAALIAEIKDTLAKNEQVLLFINRRGFAPTLICHGCGWVMRCPNCDANMVIHAQEQSLRCHHCGHQSRLLDKCPACKTSNLLPLGLGTERVEKILGQLFADKVIVRLDRDSTRRKGSLEQFLMDINDGKADIILGTQMLAKGHHFSQVTLVAMLDVDSGLFSIDYHTAEKLAQLVIQVAGRAGREQKPGKVILQTRHPDHPLLTTLVRHGYNAFAQIALQERQEAALPPFSYQALLRAQANNADVVTQFLQNVVEIAHRITGNETETLVLGPVPAPMAKRAGVYRYQILLQSPQRAALHGLLDRLLLEIPVIQRSPTLYWSLDIDPIDLY